MQSEPATEKRLSPEELRLAARQLGERGAEANLARNGREAMRQIALQNLRKAWASR
jgi:hypothetical protein